MSHCFPLTGNPAAPEVFRLEGIMQAYITALNNVLLSGPTYFVPIIDNAMQYAKLNES